MAPVSEDPLPDPWQLLLLRLGSLGQRVYAKWWMSNGAVFHFAIPRSQQIGAGSFTADVEFGFTFAEIEGMEIPARIGQGLYGLSNDLERIHQAMASVSGLVILRECDRIAISRPLPR